MPRLSNLDRFFVAVIFGSLVGIAWLQTQKRPSP